MKISGFEKLTLLNYPDQVACIIFTQGCNYHCPFCQNSPLISKNIFGGYIDEEEVLSYLIKRKGILDGICISGGEPTIQKDLENFLKKIKEIGYLVKLDTNGSNPDIIKRLIDNRLVDYIAMDIKHVFTKYQSVVCSKNLTIDDIKQSIKILEESSIKYEFRTTIIKEYHKLEDIIEIREMLNGKSNYYLQNFVNSENVLNQLLHGFTDDELEQIDKQIKAKKLNIKIRK